MPNLTSVFNAEIIRLSRKEVKAAVQPLKKANNALRKTVLDLKKRISALESRNNQLQSLQPKTDHPKEFQEIPDNLRVTSKTIQSLRKKLGLSQESFGKLLGVSSNAVFSMEHKKGQLKPRTATLSNLLALKNMSKREVNKKLEGME
ncbi:MAG: hypothetical protein JXB48_10955 [Candidatus Latescibacteria bacterium]|nr:hypothetical protein [Candidatus Latescibacterota bacterium]